MIEKVKLPGGPEKAVTWIWLDPEVGGQLQVEYCDFSEPAHKFFGNDIAWTITIHEMGKLYGIVNKNETLLVVEQEMNCPECGAPDRLCQARFDEFLVLEFTDMGYGAVHHLTVAVFMVQHSSRMTPEGWMYERELLREFLIENKPPALVRQQIKDTVDSGKRTFKFKSKTGVPVIDKSVWIKTILDVRAENAKVYCEDIAAWARSVLEEAEKISEV